MAPSTLGLAKYLLNASDDPAPVPHLPGNIQTHRIIDTRHQLSPKMTARHMQTCLALRRISAWGFN